MHDARAVDEQRVKGEKDKFELCLAVWRYRTLADELAVEERIDVDCAVELSRQGEAS